MLGTQRYKSKFIHNYDICETCMVDSIQELKNLNDAYAEQIKCFKNLLQKKDNEISLLTCQADTKTQLDIRT